MAKYSVSVADMAEQTFVVEAETEEQACEMAIDLWETSTGEHCIDVAEIHEID